MYFDDDVLIGHSTYYATETVVLISEVDLLLPRNLRLPKFPTVIYVLLRFVHLMTVKESVMGPHRKRQD